MLTLDTTQFPFRDRWNDCLVRRAVLTGPASYPTGGIAIDNDGDFGWGETHTLVGSLWNGTTQYGLVLDRANQKLIVTVGDGTQAANEANLSAFSGQIVATGK